MAIAHVQSVSVSGNNVSSITTAAISTTTGNLLVASLAHFGNFSSFTDSQSLAWTTSISELSVNDDVNGKLRQVYNQNITGSASHTFTLTLTANNYPTIAVEEISGQVTSGALDQTATVKETSSSTSHVTANTVATTQANELMVGVGSTSHTVATYTIGGSWTQRENIPTSSTAEGIVMGTRIVSATGAYNFDWTTNTSIQSIGCISTWKEGVVSSINVDDEPQWITVVQPW